MRRLGAGAVAAAALALWVGGVWPARGAEERVPGLAMIGDPDLAPGAMRLPYTSPDAVSGGVLTRAVEAPFDSLNPFILTGRAAPGVRQYHFAALMTRSWDEPFTMYGYVAETVSTPADRTWVTFHLNPAARFHDGSPITVDDVIFSFQALRDEGRLGFRRNYRLVERVDRVGAAGVRFHFTPDAGREQPLLMALMPVLSKAYYETVPFAETSLEVPLGAGPYRIAEVDPGRRILFERVADWWGRDLPGHAGQHNFQTLGFETYRTRAVAMEAFRAGAYTLRQEADAERWAIDYDFPAAARGAVTLLELPHQRPTGLSGFVFNTRRAPLDDVRVRRALAAALDFEWTNATLLRGEYTRIFGLFTNSPLAAPPLPGPEERALLASFGAQVPDRVLTAPMRPPVSDGSGTIRGRLRDAARDLAAAGFEIQNGALTDPGTGAPVRLELLLADGGLEKIAQAYARNLSRLGVRLDIRLVDRAAYVDRLTRHDFDMTEAQWRVSLSPGIEQQSFWGSTAATVEGSRNHAGVRDPVVDALVERLISVSRTQDLVTTARALDRVLFHGHYLVPLHGDTRDRIAYWGDLRRPQVTPLYGPVLEAWWQAP